MRNAPRLIRSAVTSAACHASSIRVTLASLVIALLVGCVKSTPSPIDINRADLMPEAAAKKVLGSYVPNYNGGASLYIKDGYFPIRNITTLDFWSDRGALMFRQPGTNYGTAICGLSLDDARKIAEALTALGASVTLSDVTQVGGLVPCGDVHG